MKKKVFSGAAWVRPGAQLVLVLGLCVLSAACATRGKETPVQAENAPVVGAAPTNPAPVFILGPGDELVINVWRHVELNRNMPIDPAGKIHMPLAGDIQAAGLTLAELREALTTSLSKYFVDPQVDINVASVKSQKIHVLGEVKTPGTYTLDGPLSALEAVAKAGGFTLDANPEAVLLIQKSNDVLRASALNLDLRGTLEKSIEIRALRNGDILYAAPSRIANVERFMVRLNSIINPIVNVERGIVLAPAVIDALQGKNGSSSSDQGGRTILIAP